MALEAGSSLAIAANGLTKSYRLGELRSLRHTMRMLTGRHRPDEGSGLEALSGLDFEVRRGEAIGLVGANGSGKSTLLQILSGVTLPTGGMMRVWGEVLPLLAVGHGFHPDLTGRENVLLYSASLGIRRATVEARMGAVMEFAELRRHMDTPVKRFSTGMISRLSFAVAVQFPADVYIFDEVLAVVDGEFAERCLTEIRRLHGEGRTVVFVSHRLDQVSDVCDRVLWLERGRLRQAGAPSEVLPAYERALSSEALCQ